MSRNCLKLSKFSVFWTIIQEIPSILAKVASNPGFRAGLLHKIEVELEEF
jgi:hypothetical protein